MCRCRPPTARARTRRGAAAEESLTPQLIDLYLPRFDVRERHRVGVHATAESTYAAIQTADFARSRIVRLLLALRGIPAAISRGVSGVKSLKRRRVGPVTLATFEQQGFRILESRPPDELVIGLEGRFWRPSGGVCTPPADGFTSSTPATGTARAVWNFRVVETGPTACELSTETRVLCASPEVRRRFLPYWWLVRPGSGLIRREMLRAIRDQAERGVRS